MDPLKVHLGIAPIAWTNDDLPELGGANTFEQCISEMALAGYEGSEVGNKYPKNPLILTPYLKLRNLQICNAWFSTTFLTETSEEVISSFISHRDFLSEMGAKVIGISEQGNSIQGKDLPIMKAKPYYSSKQWETVLAGFNKLADLAEERQMKLCVHHHMGTGIQTEAEIDYLMMHANPNVFLLFDSGHLYFSERSQVAVDRVIKKYSDRIVHVHLKDIRPEVLKKLDTQNWSFLKGVKEGVFAVPGDGCISFDGIFAVLARHHYEGWMVVEAEQDPDKANPFAEALKARRFIREKTGL